MSTQQTHADAAPSGAALPRSEQVQHLVPIVDSWQRGRRSVDDVVRLALLLSGGDRTAALDLMREAVERYRKIGVVDETNPPCNNEPKETDQ